MRLTIKEILLICGLITPALAFLHYQSMNQLDALVAKTVATYVQENLGILPFDDRGEYSDGVDVKAIEKLMSESHSDFADAFYSKFGLIDSIQTSIISIAGIKNPSLSLEKSPGTNVIMGSTSIYRLEKDRPIEYAFEAQPNYATYLLFCIITFLLASLLWHWLPSPLSRHQQKWKEALIDNGLDEKNAELLAFKSGVKDPLLEKRLRFFDLRCGKQKVPASSAFREVNSDTVSELSPSEWDWVILAMDKYNLAYDEALKIAKKEDTLYIDVFRNILELRGLRIEITSAPLAYYAWYLFRRVQNNDEGWISNPESRKKYPEIKSELENLFDEWSVHSSSRIASEDGKTIAERLKGNRSRIIKTIITGLGENSQIAAPYLFEEKRTGRLNSYRIRLSPENIEFVTE